MSHHQSAAILDDENFGQKVDLTVRIREVLTNYPSGSSIVKEIVQNADDAGARVVKLCYDERQFGTSSLAYPGLKDFQGASLLAFNDAKFSERDFESIQSIGNSGKKAVSGKTGRFGLGFNSSYHVTDVPSFVSGKYIVYFDPHATHLPITSISNPGKRLNFLTPQSNGSSLLSAYPDQFNPFLAFGCTLKEEFQGTMFRFPLRTPAQSKTSRLSSHAYTPADMADLLESVRKECSEMLLFLKSVERIEVHTWQTSEAQPQLMFAAHIANMNQTLLAHRSFLSTNPDLSALKQDVTFLDEVQITLTEGGGASAAAAQPIITSDTWLVCNTLSSGEGRTLAIDPTNAHCKFLPWAGVAALVKRNGGTVPVPTLEGKAFCFLPLPVLTALPVHINAFFELSSNRRDVWWGKDNMQGDAKVRTRWNEILCGEILPICYVNLIKYAASMFAVQSSTITLASSSSSINSSSTSSSDAVYQLCPQNTKTSDSWLVLISRLYQLLQDEPFLCTSLAGFKTTASATQRASIKGSWITPREAVTVDELAPAVSESSAPPPFPLMEGFGPIASILLACSMPVVRMPSKVQKLLFSHGTPRANAAPAVGAAIGPRHVDPSFIRTWLIQLGAVPAVLSRAQSLFLLQFVLSDLTASSAAGGVVASPSGSSFIKLLGVPLLPLLNGRFAKFAHKPQQIVGLGVARPVATTATAASESASPLSPTPASFYFLSASDLRHNLHTMLSPAAHALVAVDLDAGLMASLSNPGLTQTLNVSPLSETAIANELLQFCVPQAWRGTEIVEWKEPLPAASSTPATTSTASVPLTAPYSVPSREFLNLFWSYATRIKDLTPFTTFPLVPCEPGLLTYTPDGKPSWSSNKLLCRINSALHMLHPGTKLAAPSSNASSTENVAVAVVAADSHSFSAEFTRALCKLRLHVIDTSLVSSLNATPPASLFDQHFVIRPSLSAVLNYLLQAHRGDANQLRSSFNTLSHGERKAVRGWLGDQVARGSKLSESEKQLVQSFPIFQVYRDRPPFERRLIAPITTSTSSSTTSPGSNDQSNDKENEAVIMKLLMEQEEEASQFVDLTTTARALPPSFAVVSPQLLSPYFLITALQSDATLYQHLGITSLNAAEFYLRHFFPSSVFTRLHASDRDETMVRILSELPALSKQSPMFMSAVGSLAFIPTRGGLLHRPAELYDPDLEELKGLLDPEQHFPLGPFNSATVLPALRNLGLQNSLDRQGVLESALNIYKQAAQAMPAAGEAATESQVEASGSLKARAQSLLIYIDRHAMRLFADDAAAAKAGKGDVPRAPWLSSLTAIPWLPVAVENPQPPILPWNEDLISGKKSKHPDPPYLAAPAMTRPNSLAWFCSYSLRLLDLPSESASARDLSSLVHKHFAWDQPLSVQVIVEQLVQFNAKLKELSAVAGATAAGKQSSEAAADQERSREQRELLEQLSTILPQFYRQLTHFLTAETASPQVKSDNLQTLRKLLHEAGEWIFVGERFVSADKVAFATNSLVNIDCEPWFFRVPNELKIFATLFRAMGVRETFAVVDYVDVLTAMTQVYGTYSPFNAAAAAANAGVAASSSSTASTKSTAPVAKPLSARDLETAISLIQFLSDRANELHGSIYVPSDQNTLALASSLVFQDAQWLTGKKSSSAQAVLFVHPKISNAVAEKIGCKSYRSTLLADISEKLELHSSAANDPTSNLGLIEFGQKESLTQRLKNILSLYPEGVSILFELLQNADDARATEFSLLFNADSYGTNSLLSNKMEAWQGPALMCYNNAQFSEADYEALTSIGQGSKLDKLAATGRFGLGFNAVYHFSDLPSFVSGRSLVFFDPHATHLPRVSHREPGLRIPLSPQLVESFPDQFGQPYNFYGCKMYEPFDGTLFRFPLRNAATAAKSGIKREVTTNKDMELLLANFKQVVVEAMLFLRHVTKISVMVHSNGQTRALYQAELADPLQRTKSVWAKIPEFALGKQVVAVNNQQIAGGGGAATHLPKSAFFKRLESCTDADLPAGFTVTHIICNSFDYTETQEERPDLAPVGENSAADSNFSPGNNTVSVYRLKDTQTSSDTFLLSEQVGGGRSRAMAIEGAKKGLKMLPFGGVAAHILHNGKPVFLQSNDPNARGGKAFCFLPLPVTHGMPLSVNGFFELSANRRDIWMGSDMTGDGAIRSEWNQSLLLDCIAPSYARLLAASARILGTQSQQWLQLFPPPTGIKSNSSATTEAWQALAGRVYALLQQVPLLFTPCMTWRDPTTGNNPALSLASIDKFLGVNFNTQDVAKQLLPPVSSTDVTTASTSSKLVSVERELQLNGKGQWIAPRYAVTIEESDSKENDRIKGEWVKGEWIEEKKESDSSVATSSSLTSDSVTEFGGLGAILLSCGIPIVRLPTAYRQALVVNAEKQLSQQRLSKVVNALSSEQDTAVGPQHVSPSFVRNWLIGLGKVPAHLTREQTLFLLKYVLSDLNKSNWESLNGVPLVPLANGSFGTFRMLTAAASASNQAEVAPALEGPRYFLLSTRDNLHNLESLLQPASHLLIAARLEADISKFFADAAFLAQSNIQSLTEAHVASLLQFAFPQNWRGQEVVEYAANETALLATPDSALSIQQQQQGLKSPPTLDWLKQLWVYINKHVKDLSLFTAYPIVLCMSNTVQAAAPAAAAAAASASVTSTPAGPQPPVCKYYLARLSLSCNLLFPDTNKPYSASLLTLLTKLGLLVVDSSRIPLTHDAIHNFVAKATVAGFLGCIERLIQGDMKKVPSLISRSTAVERIALRDWIGVHVSTKTLEGGLNEKLEPSQKELVKHFHIFEGHGEPPKPAAATPTIPTAQPVKPLQPAKSPVSPAPSTASAPPAAAGKFYVFVDLVTHNRFIPPEGMLDSLLTSRFLKLSLPHDHELLLQLGVEKMNEAEFFQSYVFPPAILHSLSSNERNQTMIHALMNLPNLSKDRPEFVTQLQSLPFLPTKHQALIENESAVSSASSSRQSSVSSLACISDLFDPSVTEFRALLDPSIHFPSAPFDQSHILSTLVRLGLQTSLDRRGILSVATAIVNRVSKESSLHSSVVKEERERAKALLNYLDLHSSRILADDDLDDGEEGKEAEFPPKNTSSTSSSASSTTQAPDRFISRVDFLHRLNDLQWLPALLVSPESNLPWKPIVDPSSGAPYDPNAVSSAATIPPSYAFSNTKRMRPQSDAWFCSYTLKLLDGEIRSSVLLEALGWKNPFPAIVLSQQLIQLSNHRLTSASLAAQLNQIIPRIYQFLSELIESPPEGVVDASSNRDRETNKQLITSTLKNAAWLFYANTWYTSSRMAFPQAPFVGEEGGEANRVVNLIAPDAKPYLLTVPPELMPYASLLRMLGVRDRFEASDYAFVLKRIAQEVQSRGVIAAAAMQQQQQQQQQQPSAQPVAAADSPATPVSPPVSPASTTSTPGVVSLQLSERELDLCVSIIHHLSHLQEEHNAEMSAKQLQPQGASKIALLIQPSELYIPTDKNLLLPLNQVSYNDAAWLLATLANKDSIHFVHSRISNATAASLGMKSLRELLLLNQSFRKSILCPTVPKLRSELVDLLAPQRDLNLVVPEGDASVGGEANLAVPTIVPNAAGIEALSTALFDLLEMADSLGAREAKVCFDERRFASESLFNPLLAEAQGPALVLYFDSVLLSEEVVFMQSKAMEGGEEMVALPKNMQSGSAAASAVSPSSSGSSSSSRSHEMHTGHGLLSGYAFSDSLHIISGDSLFIFDPAKRLFLESNDDHQAAANNKSASSVNVKAPASASAAPPAAASAPKKESSFGRQYVFVGGSNASLPRRFSDQFKPFEELPFRFSKDKPFAGTIIRMPLRNFNNANPLAAVATNPANSTNSTNASPVNDRVLTESYISKPIMEQLISGLKSHYDHLLLFMRHLESFQLSVQPSHLQAPTVKICSSHVQVHAALRSDRLKLMGDESWKKNQRAGGLFGMLMTKSFVPLHHSYELEISSLWCDARGSGSAAGNASQSGAIETNVDQYLVSETLGEGQSREMAVKWINDSQAIRPGSRPTVGREQPAGVGRIVPLASTALRLKRNGQNSESLNSEARIFSAGLPLIGIQMPATSLPVHINGMWSIQYTEYGRFLHLDVNYRASFTKEWSRQIEQRVSKLESLKPRDPAAATQEVSSSSGPPPPQPPSQPPSHQREGSQSSAASSAASAVSKVRSNTATLSNLVAKSSLLSSMGGVQDEDDWVPRKPGVGADRPRRHDRHSDDDDDDDDDDDSSESDDDSEHKSDDSDHDENEQKRPAPPVVIAPPSVQALQLSQRKAITEPDPVASQRSLVHRYNLDLLLGSVTSYVDLLLHLKLLFEKQACRNLLYKYWPVSVTLSVMYSRLILRPFYQRVCINNPPLALFLTSSNEFLPLNSALFKHADAGVVVEGFIARFTPMFQVPGVIAEDLLICGIVEPIAPANGVGGTNQPLICSNVCTPFEFRRLARTHQQMKDALTQGVNSEVSRDLLRFALSDLGATAVSGDRYSELAGLRLVPLANGGTGIFGQRRFVVAPAAAQALLPNASDVFVSDAAVNDTHLAPHLLNPNFQRHFFAKFDSRFVAEHVSRLFPNLQTTLFQQRKKVIEWKMSRQDLQAALAIEDRPQAEMLEGRQDSSEGSIIQLPQSSSSSVAVSASPAGSSTTASPSTGSGKSSSFPVSTIGGLPSPQWIRTLWQFISLSTEDNRKALATWPLIPIRTKPPSAANPSIGSSSSSIPVPAQDDHVLVHQLASVDMFNKIMCLPSVESWSDSMDVAAALLELGYPLLDMQFFDAKFRHHPDAGGMAGSSNLFGLADRPEHLPLKFIRALPELFLSNQLHLNLSTMKENHCNSILKLLNSGFESGSFNMQDRKTVQMLPIFQIFVPHTVSGAEAPPMFRSIDSIQQQGNAFFILAPELVVTLPEEFQLFLAKQHVFLQYKFAALYRWAGVQELTKTQLLEKFLTAFLEQQFLVGASSSSSSSIDYNKQDEFIRRFLVPWVRESVLSGETKKQIAQLPLIPVHMPTVAAAAAASSRAIVGGEEGKEQVEAAASSSSSASSNSIRVPPSVLLDPRNRFFSDLFMNAPVFPAQSYQTEELLDFLVDLGMKKQMDADAFLNCARKIEESGLSRKKIKSFMEHQDELLHKGANSSLNMDHMETNANEFPPSAATASSSVSDLTDEESRLFTVAVRLLDYLISNFTDLSSPKLWKSLKTIAWVPVYFRGSRSCMKFSQISVFKDRYLTWSVLPVLGELQSPPEVLYENLGITSPPAVDIVMQHLMQCCSIPLDNWDEQLPIPHETSMVIRANPTRIFLQLFSFLQDQWHKLSQSQIQTLRQMSIVPMSNQLVKASRLYFRLDTSLAPFLFEVPRAFGQYDALFSNLGTTQSPKRRDYLKLLHELYVELQPDRTLNVNEYQAIMKILRLLAEQKESEEGLDQDENATGRGRVAAASAASIPSVLYVPDELTRLVPAFSCVYNNSSWLSQRINHSKLHFVNAGLSQELSKKLGVRALTDAVEERLEKLENIEEGSESAAHVALSSSVCVALQQLFHAQQFAKCILRLYEDQISRSQQYSQWPFIPSLDSLHELLKSFTLQFVSLLRTRLLLSPNQTDVTAVVDAQAHVDGTLALVYVDFELKIIYVNINRSEIGSVRPTLILSNAVALILEKFIRGEIDPIRNLTPLQSMFDAALLSENDAKVTPASLLEPLLDRLEILKIDHVALRRGVVGEMVHPFDASLLQLTPLRKYVPGELIAFKDSQGKHRYAEIVRVESANQSTSASSGATTTTTGETSSSADTSSNVPLFSNLLVRIHASKTALLSSADVFSFASHIGGGANMSTAAADKFLTMNAQMQQQIQAVQSKQDQMKLNVNASRVQSREEGAAAAALPSVSNFSSSSSSSSSSAPLDEDRTQLLSAVSSLLQQANLPLNLDSTNLMRENLRLRAQVEGSEKKASEAHARETKLTSRIEKLTAAYVCPICVTTDADLVLVRCGHTICSACEKQLHTKACPFCRKRYEFTIPFFRPEV